MWDAREDQRLWRKTRRTEWVDKGKERPLFRKGINLLLTKPPDAVNECAMRWMSKNPRAGARARLCSR
jgi:hypothetical protein